MSIKNLLSTLKTGKELSYIAGLLDGDGSIHARIYKQANSKFKFRLTVTIQFTLLERKQDYMITLQELFGGVGTLRTRVYKGDSIGYDFSLSGNKDVLVILKLLRPYLVQKHLQADLAIQILEQLDASKNDKLLFVKLCELSDYLSQLNNTKKRKYTSQVVKKVLLA